MALLAEMKRVLNYDEVKNCKSNYFSNMFEIKLQIFSLLLIFMFVTFSFNDAFAYGVGIRPATIDFGKMIRNGYAERDVSIVLVTDEPMKVDVKFTPDTNLTWLRLEPNNWSFTLEPGKPYSFKVIVEPGNDVPNGKYYAGLNFESTPVQQLSGQTASAVGFGVILKVFAEISDYEIRRCELKSVHIPTVITTEDKFNFSFDIYNNGNVYVTPKARIVVRDALTERVVYTDEFTFDKVKPTTLKTFTKQLSWSLPSGQYEFDFQVKDCNDGQYTHYFDILKPGELLSDGEIRALLVNPKKTVVNQPIELIAEFANIGQVDDEVKIKVVVYLQDKIIDVIESDPLLVKQGQIENFTMYYTPKQSGLYKFVAKAYYGKKVSHTKDNTVKVFPESMRSKLSPENNQNNRHDDNSSNSNFSEKNASDNRISAKFIVYMLFFIAIVLFLLIQIQKKKRAF